MSNELVSIVIPAYNHQKYVQDTINSVIAQTYQNIELIIIDDGSKDNTFQKIKELEEKCIDRFVRFSYQTQENQGTCATFNRLINLAQGKYIGFVASDDKYTPNAVTDMVTVLEQDENVALVVGKNLLMDEESKVCCWDKKKNNVYEKSKAKWHNFSDYLQHSTGVDFHLNKFGTYSELVKNNHIPNGYIIRKSIFNKTGLYTKEAPLEDYWMVLQISKYAKMVYIDNVTFYYRWHASNTIKQREKMREIYRKTINYEEDCISKLADKTWFDIFQKIRYAKKIIFNLGFVKYYKQKDRTHKKKILEILGKTCVIQQKEV